MAIPGFMQRVFKKAENKAGIDINFKTGTLTDRATGLPVDTSGRSPAEWFQRNMMTGGQETYQEQEQRRKGMLEAGPTAISPEQRQFGQVLSSAYQFDPRIRTGIAAEQQRNLLRPDVVSNMTYAAQQAARQAPAISLALQNLANQPGQGTQAANQLFGLSGTQQNALSGINALSPQIQQGIGQAGQQGMQIGAQTSQQLQDISGQILASANAPMQSAADLQMQRNVEQAIKAQQAMAATAQGQGMSPGAAARMAQMGVAGVTQQGAADAAALRVQEEQQRFAQRLAAQQAAAGTTATAGQLGLAGTGQQLGALQAQYGVGAGTAGLGLQAGQQAIGAATAAGQLGLASTGQQADILRGAYDVSAAARGQELAANQLQIQDINSRNQMALGLGAQDIERAQLTMGGQMALEDAIQNYYGRALGLGESSLDRATQLRLGMLGKPVETPAWQTLTGAGLGAVGSLGAGYFLGKSDERAKKNIDREQGSKDIGSFLDALNAALYEYKEPELDGQGPRYSVMAQELQKSKVGRTFVHDTPRGLMVDYGAGFGAMLAAQADMNKRLRKVEAGKG